MSLFSLTKTASEKIDDIELDSKQRYFKANGAGTLVSRRTLYSVLTSATSELGELADEVRIEAGHSYKEAGVDGIIGEAIDTIVCLLDLIHLENPDMTEQELDAIAFKKLNKWVTKVSGQVK